MTRYLLRTIELFDPPRMGTNVWEGFEIVRSDSAESAIDEWSSRHDVAERALGLVNLARVRTCSLGYWAPSGVTTVAGGALDIAELKGKSAVVMLMQFRPSRDPAEILEATFFCRGRLDDPRSAAELVEREISATLDDSVQFHACCSWEYEYANFVDGEEILWLDSPWHKTPLLRPAYVSSLANNEWRRVGSPDVTFEQRLDCLLVKGA